MPSHLLLPEGYTLSSLKPNDPPPAPAESGVGARSQFMAPDLYMENKGTRPVLIHRVTVLEPRNVDLRGYANPFYSLSAFTPDVDMRTQQPSAVTGEVQIFPRANHLSLNSLAVCSCTP